MRWVTGARALLIAFTVLCLVTQDLIPEAPAGWRILTAYPRVYALAVFWLLMVAAQRRLGGAGRLRSTPGHRFAIVFAGLVVALVVVLDAALRRPVRALRAAAAAGAAGWPAHQPVAVAGAGRGRRSSSCAWTRAAMCSIERPRPSGPCRPRARTCFTRPSLPADPSGWAEVAAAGGSRVVRFPPNAAELFVAALPTEIEDAGTPAISRMEADWGSSARDRGRGQLWLLERLHRHAATRSRAPTGTSWILASSRTIGWCSPDAAAPRRGCSSSAPDTAASRRAARGVGRPMRNPAVSPDGRWLAYTERERGNWQLWLLSLERGERRRLTSADCNSISPAWRPDSRSLVYATDCARGVALTTLAELQRSVSHNSADDVGEPEPLPDALDAPAAPARARARRATLAPAGPGGDLAVPRAVLGAGAARHQGPLQADGAGRRLGDRPAAVHDGRLHDDLALRAHPDRRRRRRRSSITAACCPGCCSRTR